MSAHRHLQSDSRSPQVEALVEQARRTTSSVRHLALLREINLILREERYAAGPIELKDVYFREVGMIPTLSAAYERLLFEDMRSAQEDLRKHVEKWTDARERLIRSHLRLVIAVAREYRNRGLPFMDLIQEGNLGLEKAVDRFDHRRGHRLSTYAIWSINSAVSRAVANQSRTIRIPVSVQRKLIRIARVEARYGYPPTNEELAWETKIPIEEIEWLKRHTTPPVSLDATRPGTDDEGFEEIADEASLSPEEEVIEADLAAMLRKALSFLPHRQRQVLELRFGFDETEPQSLEEIGEVLGLSRERVRQIEAEALERLRAILDP